mmetsp:Transcript_21935/g.34365  ORF Transcript_21935/g.34365 Transcript_21935/m.34365 type:complete len:93 (-) Transcript_21935:1895-2173(-)
MRSFFRSSPYRLPPEIDLGNSRGDDLGSSSHDSACNLLDTSLILLDVEDKISTNFTLHSSKSPARTMYGEQAMTKVLFIPDSSPPAAEWWCT